MTRGGRLILTAGLALTSLACEQNGNGQDGAIAVLAGTESVREFGDYEVHFNALTTDQLDPDIASEYQIVRSRNSVLLTVSVLRKREDGVATAVSAEVDASARNLTGQLKNLLISEIREAEAIYYVAETPIVNSETLVFTVEATPEGATEALTVSFQKQFFVGE
jgi:hypothetical protein